MSSLAKSFRSSEKGDDIALVLVATTAPLLLKFLLVQRPLEGGSTPNPAEQSDSVSVPSNVLPRSPLEVQISLAQPIYPLLLWGPPRKLN